MSKISKVLNELNSFDENISLQEKSIDFSNKIAKFVKSLSNEEDKQNFIDMFIGNLYGNPITSKYMKNSQ